jgi:FMN phosphatase YigB (HAD superfamily)
VLIFGAKMNIVSLPKVINALVFDIDLTLYDSREYYRSQTDALVEKLAERLGKSFPETMAILDERRRKAMAESGGREISLGNLFIGFGVSIEENARWRDELYSPEEYLVEDPRLIQALKSLNEKFVIAAITNNSRTIGIRTLRVLGVESFFREVIGLDCTLVSKPHIKPFRLLSDRLGIPFDQMVSVGDRMAVDIELPVSLGMGGILVASMEDVYGLPGALSL